MSPTKFHSQRHNNPYDPYINQKRSSMPPVPIPQQIMLNERLQVSHQKQSYIPPGVQP